MKCLAKSQRIFSISLERCPLAQFCRRLVARLSSPHPSTLVIQQVESFQLSEMDRIAGWMAGDSTTTEAPMPSSSSTNAQAERSRSKRTTSTEPEHQLPFTSSNEKPTTSTTPNISRPTSSRPNSTRRYSTAQASTRLSNTCSRRSSFLVRQPSETHPWRPRVPQRRSSTAHYHTYSTDSPASHSRSVLLFQSLEASLANGIEPFSSRPKDHLTSASLPAPLSPATAVKPCPSQSSSTLLDSPKLQQQHSYSNHVPATIIDWTLPSTRRRQYERIEKSSRGIRGLVRRFTPIPFRSNGNRVGFYDAEKGSDAGTVRRYRLDADDNDSDAGEMEDEKHRGLMDVLEVGRSRYRGGRGIGSSWSCFVLGRNTAK